MVWKIIIIIIIFNSDYTPDCLWFSVCGFTFFFCGTHAIQDFCQTDSEKKLFPRPSKKNIGCPRSSTILGIDSYSCSLVRPFPVHIKLSFQSSCYTHLCLCDT